MALFTEAVGGRVDDGSSGAEVTGVKVAEDELGEDELAVATPARRSDIEASVNCILWGCLSIVKW